MRRFYSEEEVRGALVYDCEGLLYGEVGGLALLDSGAFIDVYLRRRVGEPAVDVERLAGELGRRGLSVEGRGLAELVALARELGVEVPYRTLDRDLSFLKARVPVEEVLWVDCSRPELKVVLLATPREAEFRGWRPRPPPRIPRRGDVEGRPVLSLSGGVLGFAEGVVVGPGEVGVRVRRSAGGREVGWLAFISALRRNGKGKLAERLAGEIDPYANPRLTGEAAERAVRLVRELGSSEDVELLMKHVSEPRDVVDVPWSSVVRLGDAVIVE